MAVAGIERGGEKRRARRNECERREIEIGDAFWRVNGKKFDDERGGLHSVPVNAIVAGDDQAAAHVSGGRESVGEQSGPSGVVAGLLHGGAD